MVEPLSLFVTVRSIDDIRNNMHTGSILDCSPHRIHSRAKRKIDVRRCNLDICLVTQSRWNIGFIYDIWCERDSAFHVVSFVSFSAKFATSHCTIRSVDHPPPPLTYITPIPALNHCLAIVHLFLFYQMDTHFHQWWPKTTIHGVELQKKKINRVR